MVKQLHNTQILVGTPAIHFERILLFSPIPYSLIRSKKNIDAERDNAQKLLLIIVCEKK